MNEPNTPTPNLDHVPQPAADVEQPTAAAISHSVNPPSTQQSISAPQASQPAAQPQLANQVATGKSILIVEDERFISELYTRALGKAGYQVTTASDGEEALHTATNGNFDLILLDIMLPTMNGVDLLYKMKDPNVQPPMKSKVIITTNMDQEEKTKKKVEAMADGYLIKAEVTPKELVNYVSQVFGN